MHRKHPCAAAAGKQAAERGRASACPCVCKYLQYPVQEACGQGGNPIPVPSLRSHTRSAGPSVPPVGPWGAARSISKDTDTPCP